MDLDIGPDSGSVAVLLHKIPYGRSKHHMRLECEKGRQGEMSQAARTKDQQT